MEAAWAERPIYGTAWSVALDETRGPGAAWVVTVRDHAGAVVHERGYDTWPPAADAYAHPFADETVPTPFEREPLAEALA